jgi:CDGSH-type Zn-finger protein
MRIRFIVHSLDRCRASITWDTRHTSHEARYGLRVEPVIEIVLGGPMIVRGGVPLVRILRGSSAEPGWTLSADLDGGELYRLCRCGRSRTMPMCERIEPYGCFEEEAPTRELAKPPMWDIPDPGTARVALKPDGPIRVAGDTRVIGPSGPDVPAHQGRRSLCRCAASRSQPLCDGSHKLVPPIGDPEPGGV